MFAGLVFTIMQPTTKLYILEFIALGGQFIFFKVTRWRALRVISNSDFAPEGRGNSTCQPC